MLWEVPQVLRAPFQGPQLAARPARALPSAPPPAIGDLLGDELGVAAVSQPTFIQPARTGLASAEVIAAAPRFAPSDATFSAPLVVLSTPQNTRGAQIQANFTAVDIETDPAVPKADAIAASSRWRTDAWVAWRAGSALPAMAAGPRPASYGGSQAGFVTRYRLFHSSSDPALYLRTAFAPDQPRQTELAAGIGARPLARVPLRVQAELRATRTPGDTEVRPAVLAISELAPIDLPFGFGADAYAQGGWVGGRYSTAFADGQVRVTRPIARAGPLRIGAGAGAWGGAQKFAERIDVGPTLDISVGRGPLPFRLALDYRIKAAGNASPGNGIAVTLATGF